MVCVGSQYEQLKAANLVNIFRWHQSTPTEIGGKEANYKKWQEVCGIDPPAYLKWTNINEDQLVDLKKREIDISDTALGRCQENNRRELVASMHLYTEDKFMTLETTTMKARYIHVDNILPIKFSFTMLFITPTRFPIFQQILLKKEKVAREEFKECMFFENLKHCPGKW